MLRPKIHAQIGGHPSRLETLKYSYERGKFSLTQNYLKIGDFGCAIYTQTLRKTVVGCLAYISP